MQEVEVAVEIQLVKNAEMAVKMEALNVVEFSVEV